ncbi:2-phospho-L-lactate guanylyltransferase [Balneatrix alpica]|uniref:3-phospho-D-glycerate guanylyltransferase n=1 Tax=Balneatrix alpica TaxID=75684 RepID=A0ABV5ZDR5_9GAMM|nr:2-phospho-L-lactate guanylyltransferase [Balneatrix alpica]
MQTLIVIPMKDPSQAKQRLEGYLSADERAELALTLFEQTLAFLGCHLPQYPVLVVTASTSISERAQRYGAQVLQQSGNHGLNQAAASAAQWAKEQGYQAQLLLPADIAQLDKDELQHLLSQAGCQVVLAPAHDLGTNALLTSPPDVLPFCFGPGSSLLHRQQAEQRGLRFVQLELPHLAEDLDTPADLQQLAAARHASTAREWLSCLTQ